MEVGEGNGPPTPVLLPGKSHGRRRLVGCHPWGREESDTTERLHFHFSLSCVGEGNGNPLQCSCLENPRDGRAWWAAVYGVTQSRTRLKRLNSSSNAILIHFLKLQYFSTEDKSNPYTYFQSRNLPGSSKDWWREKVGTIGSQSFPKPT